MILWFMESQPPKSAAIAILCDRDIDGVSRSDCGPIMWPFHRDSQAFKERLLLERLAQKANSAGAHSAAAVVLVGVSGNENDRRAITLRL
jgi:hypothetical protein